MNPDETGRLEAFLKRTERMRARPILTRGGLSTSWGISFNEATGVRFTTKEPEDDAFRSLLLDLRPFTMAKERVYMKRVHNILYDALNDTALRDTLAETRAEWKLAQRGAVALMVNDDTYNAERVFDYWLNGFYFHDDDYKADALAALPPVVAALSRNMMYSLVIEAVRAVSSTAWVIAHAQRRSALG